MENTDCSHEEKVLRVIGTFATCEVTAEFCKDCNEQLSEPKTEC